MSLKPIGNNLVFIPACDSFDSWPASTGISSENISPKNNSRKIHQEYCRCPVADGTINRWILRRELAKGLNAALSATISSEHFMKVDSAELANSYPGFYLSINLRF